MKSNAPLWIVSLGQGPGGGGGLPGMAEVDGFTFVSGDAGPAVASQAVTLADGTSATIYTMLGSTSYATLRTAEVDEFDIEGVGTTALVSATPRTFSMTCSKPGVLYGAMIAGGGTGGVSQWASAGNPIYQPQGGAGGAGGVLTSKADHPMILLPYEGAYTIVVGGTSVGAPNYGVRNGQNTTITHDDTGYAITAAGGGGGGSAASNSGYPMAAGSGGSAGAPTYGANPLTEAARQWRGNCVPGQGHEAGQTNTYCSAGGGGAGSVGYDGGNMGTAVGGDGVDLRAKLDLDPNDAGVVTWATAYTDPDNPGFVAGGGTGRTGDVQSPVSVSVRSIGGGGQSNTNQADRDARPHTGSGGGAGHYSLPGGNGANGAVHVVVV